MDLRASGQNSRSSRARPWYRARDRDALLAKARGSSSTGATRPPCGRQLPRSSNTVKARCGRRLASAIGARKLLDETRHSDPSISGQQCRLFEARRYTDISDQDWLDMFELNVMSGVRVSRALFPWDAGTQLGRVIFIGSDQSAKPNIDMRHYAMTKTAQVSIRARLARNLTRAPGVTVNSVLVAPNVVGRRRGLPRQGRAAPRQDVNDLRSELPRHTGRVRCCSAGRRRRERRAGRVSARNGLSDQRAAQRADGGIVRSLF